MSIRSEAGGRPAEPEAPPRPTPWPAQVLESLERPLHDWKERVAESFTSTVDAGNMETKSVSQKVVKDKLPHLTARALSVLARNVSKAALLVFISSRISDGLAAWPSR